MYLFSVGDSCNLGKGVCRLVSDCPSAIDAIQARKKHNHERCGFLGFIEIVCCMDDINDNSDTGNVKVRQPTVTRKSMQGNKNTKRNKTSLQNTLFYFIFILMHTCILTLFRKPVFFV